MAWGLVPANQAIRFGRPDWFRVLNYTALTLGAFAMLFPLFWMINTSLKPLPDTQAYPPIWLPIPPRLENYTETLAVQPFGRYLLNSFIIAAAVVIGDLVSCSFAAYGFARLRFPGRDFLFKLLVSTMMVPFIVRLVPLFLLFQQLKWINTYWPLIVPAYFGTPFFIFLMRQFFLTIPGELTEAARIDGANEIVIWSTIFLPLSRPALVVVAVMAFGASWNEFLAPLIFINDKDKWTAAIGLAAMFQTTGIATLQWNLLMAAATMTVVPTVVLFLLTQRYFIRGVAMTGIKG